MIGTVILQLLATETLGRTAGELTSAHSRGRPFSLQGVNGAWRLSEPVEGLGAPRAEANG